MIYILRRADKERMLGVFSSLGRVSNAVNELRADGCEYPMCWDEYQPDQISHIPIRSEYCFIPKDWSDYERLPRGVNLITHPHGIAHE